MRNKENFVDFSKILTSYTIFFLVDKLKNRHILAKKLSTQRPKNLLFWSLFFIKNF